MKTPKILILLIWIFVDGIYSELTLESVYQEVMDLKLEVTTLKVNYKYQFYKYQAVI